MIAVTTVVCHQLSWGQGELKILVPSSLADTEGNAATIAGVAARFQMVFPASDFTSLPESHRTITVGALRPDEGNATTETVSGRMVVRMSTTFRNANELSDSFAENLLDATTPVLVLDDTLSFQTDNVPTDGPRDFDLVIPLQTPYYYDPSQGNLLIDATIPTNWDNVDANLQIDMNPAPGANYNTLASFDPLSPSGMLLHGGFPMELTFVVPEPSSLAMVVIGTFALLGMSRRQRRDHSF